MVKPLIDGRPPEPQKKENGRVTMIRKYELITPLFGGGVKANEVDVENPIRGTAVRGHLRFWWRATRGGRCNGSLDEMTKREGEIWGTTDQGSKITITVIESNPGQPYVARYRGDEVDVGDPNSPLGYVAFPLNQHGEKVYEGATFTLQIDCPKAYRPDLKAALWAWETFGGIGARTRRGFGALHCVDVQLYIDGKKYKVNNWIWEYASQNTEEDIAGYMGKWIVEENFPDDVPCLDKNSRRTHITPAAAHAETAWKDLFGSLKKFRQNRAPNAQGRPYGRSRWPDPDAIRNLTGQSLKARGHDTPVYPATPTNPAIDKKFPRAAFGLPIVFEFHRDQRGTTPNTDPITTELKPMDYKRRASRLILRPLKCSDGRFVGVATILQGKIIPPGGLELTKSPRNPIVGAEKLDPKTEAPRIQANHPNYNGKTDILQAFLDQLP